MFFGPTFSKVGPFTSLTLISLVQLLLSVAWSLLSSRAALTIPEISFKSENGFWYAHLSSEFLLVIVYQREDVVFLIVLVGEGRQVVMQ
jgi:hypothetical protein